jgi:A/G-specific adenine glycosylase
LAVGYWEKSGKLLLGRRPETGLFGGLWEMPSAELSGKPTGRKIASALSKAAGASLVLDEECGVVRRTLTHRDLELHLFRVSGSNASKVSAYQELRWASFGEAAKLGMSTAMAEALSRFERN